MLSRSTSSAPLNRTLRRRDLLRHSRSALLALGTMGVLAACSDGADTGSAPSPSASGTGSPTPSADTTPSASASTTPSSTASASASASATEPEGPPHPKVAGTIATGLNVPWGICFLSSGDALVSERDTAKLVRISPSGDKQVLGTVAGVQSPSGLGEGGLLGIAIDPDDEETLFAYLTSNSDNRVVRLSLAGGKVGRPTPILTGIPTSTHHHGGRLLFAPDGNLFVSTGDAERPSLAQDRSSLAGKVLRITTDGKAASGNPFGNRTWTYGHRNIEGLAFDGDGRLWATEFGDKHADELNLLTKGGNYGWPQVEGNAGGTRYVQPKATWSPTSTSSPAGLAITRDTAFVGALQGRCLFTLPLDGTSAGKATAHFAGTYGRIRTVVAAPDGSVWMTTSNTDGRTTPKSGDDRILRVSL